MYAQNWMWSETASQLDITLKKGDHKYIKYEPDLNLVFRVLKVTNFLDTFTREFNF